MNMHECECGLVSA